MTQFYTYIYSDPSRENEPFYVGKGSNRRAWKHLNGNDNNPALDRRIKKMGRFGIQPNIKVENCSSEQEAFNFEIRLIQRIGRKNLGTGPLLNLTDGGDAPPPGPGPSAFKPGNKSVTEGKIWITDGTINKPHDPLKVIPRGWKRGMTKNFSKDGLAQLSANGKRKRTRSWCEHNSKARQGKGTGTRNAMANPIWREKARIARHGAY